MWRESITKHGPIVTAFGLWSSLCVDLQYKRICLWGAVAVCALGGVLTFGFTVDDAYIIARYAQRIANGQGYTFSGELSSDGVTGPLWLLPFLFAELLNIDSMLVAKILGLLLTCLGVGLTLQKLSLEATRTALGVAAFAIGTALSLWVWSSAGLETGLAVLLCAILCSQEDAKSVGIAAGLLFWVRPEASLFAIVMVSSQRRASTIAASFVLLLLLFRVLMFHQSVPLHMVWFPLSAFAKQGDLLEGGSYLLRASLMCTGIGGTLIAVVGVRRHIRLGIACAAYLLCIALAGGDWMPGFRLLAPLLTAYVLLLAAGIEELESKRRWLAITLTVLTIGIPSLHTALHLSDLMGADEARLASKLTTQLSGKDKVAMVDIGFVGSELPEVEFVDLGGVTDPKVAALPGGHLDKQVNVGLLSMRNPDAIVLHSTSKPRIEGYELRNFAGYPVERRVLGMPWVQRNFRPVYVEAYSENYYYVLLERLAD